MGKAQAKFVADRPLNLRLFDNKEGCFVLGIDEHRPTICKEVYGRHNPSLDEAGGAPEGHFEFWGYNKIGSYLKERVLAELRETHLLSDMVVFVRKDSPIIMKHLRARYDIPSSHFDLLNYLAWLVGSSKCSCPINLCDVDSERFRELRGHPDYLCFEYRSAV